MSGFARSLYKCAVLWRAIYGPSATKRPFGNISEEKGISSPGSGFLSRCNMILAVESDVKTHSFLLLILSKSKQRAPACRRPAVARRLRWREGGRMLG